MRRRAPSLRASLLAVVALGLFAGLLLINYRIASASAGMNAFVPRWAAARELIFNGSSPYAPEVAAEAQLIAYGRLVVSEVEDRGRFLHPIGALLFYLPLGGLPYPLALAAWMTLLELALPALVLIAFQLTRWKPAPVLMALLLLFPYGWFHGAQALLLTDLSPLIALCLTGAWIALGRGMDRLAGVLLALSFSMPQMAIIFVAYLLFWAIAKRRWQILGWFFGGLLVLYALPLLFFPGWLLDWLRQVAGVLGSDSVQVPIFQLGRMLPAWSLLLGLGFFSWLLLMLVWQWLRSLESTEKRFHWTAALSLAIGILLMPHASSVTYLILTPIVILVAQAFSARKGLGSWMLGIFLLLLIGGPWSIYLLTPGVHFEAPGLFLFSPLLLLLGLWWTRWWMINKTTNALTQDAA